jgi:hypothetical protein
MKKLFPIVMLMVCSAGFAQRGGNLYLKTFPGNMGAIYSTNISQVGGLTFTYRTPSDTNNMVYYIENFKPEDIKVFQDKIKLYSSMLCLPGYKSKIGDFIYSFTSENEILYFYHKADRPRREQN